MGISGIGNFGEYGGLFNYYRINDIPVVDVEIVSNQDLSGDIHDDSLGLPAGLETPAEPDQRSRVANLEDVSLSMNKTDYDYIGKDASLANLDVQSQVSEARKDSILDDYNYFVTPGMLGSNEDGTVFLK